MNVFLPIELAGFVKAKVSSGRLTSTSAVVRAALRLMEQVEQQDNERLRGQREAWADWIDSRERDSISPP